MSDRIGMKDISKIVLFTGVIALLLLLFSAMMHPAKWLETKEYQNRDTRYIMIGEQPADTIDVLNIGDSLSLSVFNPMELWREKGYTGFNIGADGLRMAECYYSIKNACKNQKPKVLMMETLYLFRYSLTDDSVMLLSQPIYYRVPSLKYHNIWKSLFERPSVMIYHRGYTVNENQGPYEGPANYMDLPLEDTKAKTDIPSFNKKWFDRIKNYCDENDIELILYSSASAKNYNWERVHNLEAFAEEEGVEYYDLNQRAGEIGINWEEDTNDGGDHMNYFGSVKSTKFFGDLLASKGIVTDHRGDAAYQDWDEELVDFDRLVKDMKGQSFQDIFKQRERDIWNKKYNMHQEMP